MNQLVRKAKPEELDSIYLMGFDVWSDGGAQADYLAGCRSSPKYKKGTWFVLEENGQLLSSLITYAFESNINIIGIGSIATAAPERSRGHASKLISEVVDLFERENQRVQIFLYSDINPKFYERFGFKGLPPIAQRDKTSTCMVRGLDPNVLTGTDKVPEYF